MTEIRHQQFRSYPSGTLHWPWKPRPQDIRAEDIAWSLSMICRYGGHVPFRWTVAQHSMVASDLCDRPEQKRVLLHDASEAYCNDIISPQKKGLPQYREMEELWHKAIAEKFNLPYPHDEIVHAADHAAYELEQFWLFQGSDLTPQKYRMRQEEQYISFLERLKDLEG